MKSDKLILLDVGSCFNPFQTYCDVFIPLAIDLCPADEVSELVPYQSHSINSRATQQCNMSPYFYAVIWPE